jgi:hypothetical protein
MSTTAETLPASDEVCIPDERSLPDGPFTSLRYHFGMLLGVDDFSTEQRYHRGKMRLHSAWLHRAGIVWGLDVDVVADKREIGVEPGLGLDPTGRELHLDVRCCLDIGAWFDKHKDEIEPRDVEVDGEAAIQFDGRVELVFCACGTRPVPAISAPCEGAAVDTAYARTFETVSIRFVPKLAEPKPPPYPRLRGLFGIDELALSDEEQQAVDDARAAVLASDGAPLTLLEQFRKLADGDAVAMEPAVPTDKGASVFPALEDEGIVLANVRDITLVGSEGNWKLAGATVDRTPRRVHVATQTIEELLCGGGIPGAGGAAGPQVKNVDVDGKKRTVSLTLDKAVAPASVRKDSFSISLFDDTAGWSVIALAGDPTLSNANKKIGLEFAATAGTYLFRLIAYGTGPIPIVGKAAPNLPLAGADGDPPGTKDDGRDFVHMTTLTIEDS